MEGFVPGAVPLHTGFFVVVSGPRLSGGFISSSCLLYLMLLRLSACSSLMRSGSQFCVLNNHLFALTSAEACFAPGFSITNAAFSRQDSLRAYQWLDELLSPTSVHGNPVSASEPTRWLPPDAGQRRLALPKSSSSPSLAGRAPLHADVFLSISP